MTIISIIASTTFFTVKLEETMDLYTLVLLKVLFLGVRLNFTTIHGETNALSSKNY